MQKWQLLTLALMISGLAFLAGCDGGSASNGENATLSVYMTDAAPEQFAAIYVTIDEVWVHRPENGEAAEDDNGGSGVPPGAPETDGGWERVASPERTYNLLSLVNGALAELGTTDLPSGRYTQIRLMLGDEPDGRANIRGHTHPDEMPNYVILADTNNDPTDDIEPLEIPSGYQTGIKLVHEFVLEAGISADLVLDFDAARSVVVAGQSGKYLLKPTIKIIDIEEFPLVRGVVTSGGGPLPDARVSAQVFDAEAPDSNDSLTVVTSTLTDENGAYQMYLPVGSYNIVAYKRPGAALEEDDYYGPACGTVNARFTGSVYEQNLSLGIFQTGNILVTVFFPANGEEELQTASISVREASVCSESTEMVEIAGVAGSGSSSENMFEYTLSVPGKPAEAEREGTPYTVVAESGGALIEKEIEVRANLNTPVAFDFRSPE